MRGSQKRSLNFLPQIDGLRFLAVFGVMIHHWGSQGISSSVIFKNIPFGTGVNLFFVISGFLISYILLNNKDEIEQGKTSFGTTIKNFYIKRTLRIFPVYYLVILALYIFSYDAIKDYLVYLLTYSINWFMIYSDSFISYKTHLWSLAVEEQFYLIWPFLILLVPKRWVLPLIFLAIIVSFGSKIYFMFFSQHNIGINASTFSCFDSLGLGALIAFIQKRNNGNINIMLLKWGGCFSIILYILLIVYPGWIPPALRDLFNNFLTSLVYFFVVFIAANNGFNGLFRSFLENKIVLYLGKISYGLYLFHNFMTPMYFESGFNQLLPAFKSDADFFILYFLLSVILASISWYLIERPILSFKKYFQ